MNKFIQANQLKMRKERDISFHYTNENMVKDLIKLTPIKQQNSVLDAGSGKNKVWYKNIKNYDKYECEIENNCDFYKWSKKVDWIIGNPPFSSGWKFLEKASIIANIGIAFLGNINFYNCLTPVRLTKLKEKGFTIKHIHIIADKRWFGRYYYIIFTKENNNFISWNTFTY